MNKTNIFGLCFYKSQATKTAVGFCRWRFCVNAVMGFAIALPILRIELNNFVFIR